MLVPNVWQNGPSKSASKQFRSKAKGPVLPETGPFDRWGGEGLPLALGERATNVLCSPYLVLSTPALYALALTAGESGSLHLIQSALGRERYGEPLRCLPLCRSSGAMAEWRAMEPSRRHHDAARAAGTLIAAERCCSEGQQEEPFYGGCHASGSHSRHDDRQAVD